MKDSTHHSHLPDKSTVSNYLTYVSNQLKSNTEARPNNQVISQGLGKSTLITTLRRNKIRNGIEKKFFANNFSIGANKTMDGPN